MKKIMSILLAAVLAFALCACGRSYNKSAPSEAELPDPGFSWAQAGKTEEYGGFAAVPAPDPASEKDTGRDDETGVAKESNDKIIYSAEATVETTEFDSTLEALSKLIEKNKGWTESSSINGVNYNNIQRGWESLKSAYYTIRVPSENFNSLMSNLSNLGNIPYSHTYTDNISARYYDTQARLNSYKAQEKRLIELLDKADNVTDVIEIEKALTEVRYNIESEETTIRGWDRQVAYSTVNLTVQEVTEYTPEAAQSYSGKIIQAFKNGFDTLKEFLLLVVEALPVLVAAVLIIWGIVAAIGTAVRSAPERRKRRIEKKEIKLKEKAEKKAEKEIVQKNEETGTASNEK